MNKCFFTTLLVVVSVVFAFGNKNTIDSKVQATICYYEGANHLQTIKQVVVDLAVVVAQNDCVDANLSPLTDGTPDNGTTVGASDEGYPNPPGVVGSYVDVWYEYTVPAGANRLRITFTNDPDMGVPDEVVTIYDNTCGPPLTGERIYIQILLLRVQDA